MKKLSYVGLGVMGYGMAMNLAKGEKSGKYKFLAVDRDEHVLQKFKEKGYQSTNDIGEATDSDYIFLCLPNLEIVKDVVLGENGLIHKLKPGQVIVDFSTISYLGAIEIAEKCKEKNIEFLDCPISGQQSKSLDGTLSIMCGGKEEVFNQVKSYLDCMGSQVLYMGDNGAGQLTKMINNCALNICVASFSELMPVGVKLGLNPEKLGDVLMTATGSSFASQTLIPKVLEGNFEHGFSLGRAYKDMESMFEVLTKSEIPLPTLSGTMQSYQMALQKGYRDEYKHAMVKVYEELLDVKVRKANYN
ncbi:NAD(P)-dependent oxidoreductase [Chryseomicrobium palamuruense]|uniref:NAD(P)-dependent oxidoreductase n=1 Tax=Chryseomicrobium palamuruense TaxID=682973 RepID=A0ABV8UV04_9BACL